MLPGLDAPPAKPEEVAKYTVRTIMRTTPAAVPGIHFLSGLSHRITCNMMIAVRLDDCDGTSGKEMGQHSYAHRTAGVTSMLFE